MLRVGAVSPSPHTEVSRELGAGVRPEEERGSRFWSDPGLQRGRQRPRAGQQTEAGGERVPGPLLPAVGSRSCGHHAQAPSG